MNTALNGSGRVDEIKGRSQGEIRGPTKLVKITEDSRRYATERSFGEEEALKQGLEGKATEFAQVGELYQEV